jgi:hypothetical protein
VAEHVIDRLEAVKIHTKQRKAFIRNRRQSDRGNDALIERGAIRNVGQRIVMGQVLDALLVVFPFGEVVDHADEILRSPVFLYRQSRRGDDSCAVTGRLHGVFVAERGLARSNHFPIFGFDHLRAGWRHHIGYRFAEHGRAINAEIFFSGTVDQQILQGRHALHDDGRRHVFDDRVEECPRALQFAFGSLAFGNVLVGCDPAAARHRVVDDRDGTAVLQFDIQRERPALHERGTQVGVVTFRIKRKGAGLHARR